MMSPKRSPQLKASKILKNQTMIMKISTLRSLINLKVVLLLKNLENKARLLLTKKAVSNLRDRVLEVASEAMPPFLRNLKPIRALNQV